MDPKDVATLMAELGIEESEAIDLAQNLEGGPGRPLDGVPKGILGIFDILPNFRFPPLPNLYFPKRGN